MMNGRNNGKKLMAIRIVAHAFEIVRFYTLFGGLMDTRVKRLIVLPLRFTL